jgi:hypothetical protein
MQRWVLSLLAVLFSTNLAVAQQQPQTSVTPQRGAIPQIVVFDNDSLLGNYIHIFGTSLPTLSHWPKLLRGSVELTELGMLRRGAGRRLGRCRGTT